MNLDSDHSIRIPIIIFEFEYITFILSPKRINKKENNILCLLKACSYQVHAFLMEE